jgi:hypothetical protein
MQFAIDPAARPCLGRPRFCLVYQRLGRRRGGLSGDSLQDIAALMLWAISGEHSARARVVRDYLE